VAYQTISPWRKSRSCGVQFRAKSFFFCKFCLGAQFLHKFATLRSAIFSKIRKLRTILAHFQRNFGANSTNYTKNSCITVTVLYFLNKTVKNFWSQPQNIYVRLSDNFSPIFSSICAQLAQIVHNFSAFSEQFSHKFCANFAFFPANFFRDWMMLISMISVTHWRSHEMFETFLTPTP